MWRDANEKRNLFTALYHIIKNIRAKHFICFNHMRDIIIKTNINTKNFESIVYKNKWY